MKFKNAKDMISSIVEHGKENNAYILPNDNNKEDIIGFHCVYSGKKWRISSKNYNKTASSKEKLILKHYQLRQYFCRAATCKMHDAFEQELKSYLKYMEWFEGLSEKKKNFMLLVEKYRSLTK